MYCVLTADLHFFFNGMFSNRPLIFPLQHWVFPWNLFAFQNINFTHSLLSLLTVRKLCNESVIKLGTVWKSQISELKEKQRRQDTWVFTGSVSYMGQMHGFTCLLLVLWCHILSRWYFRQAGRRNTIAHFWVGNISGSGVASHQVEAWKIGRVPGCFVTSRLSLPPGFVLCLSVSGTWRVDNLFRQLKMELCAVEDYEIAVWFVGWIFQEAQFKHPALAMVLNYDT